jgi:hypothetical protein
MEGATHAVVATKNEDHMELLKLNPLKHGIRTERGVGDFSPYKNDDGPEFG